MEDVHEYQANIHNRETKCKYCIQTLHVRCYRTSSWMKDSCNHCRSTRGVHSCSSRSRENECRCCCRGLIEVCEKAILQRDSIERRWVLMQWNTDSRDIYIICLPCELAVKRWSAWKKKMSVYAVLRDESNMQQNAHLACWTACRLRLCTWLILLHIFRRRTVDEITTIFAATWRTPMSIRPTSIIGRPSANTMSSYSRWDVITHRHEWRTVVITVAARGASTLVTVVVGRTSADTAAGPFDRGFNRKSCYRLRLRMEAVARTIRIRYCRHSSIRSISPIIRVDWVKAPRVFVWQGAIVIQAVAGCWLTTILITHKLGRSSTLQPFWGAVLSPLIQALAQGSPVV